MILAARPGPARRWWAVRVVAAAAIVVGAGCATTPPPVSKIVGGKVVLARAIHPDAYEHVARAQLFQEEERWQDAIDELGRAIEIDREAPELHAQIAELELELGREDRAARAAEKSIGLGETPVGLIAQSHVRQRQHDGGGAVAALVRATELVSFAEGADLAMTVYLELADLKLELLDLEGARTTLRELAREAPAATVPRVRLAAVAWTAGDMAEVEKSLREALVIEPNHVEALLTLAWLMTASGRLDEANARFAEALERAENALDVATAYARFLMLAGKPTEAGQLCEDLSNAPDDDSLIDRIELCRAAHRTDRALALSRERRARGETDPDLAARLDLVAADLLAEKERPRALALLLAVPRAVPAFTSARLRAAELYREAGQAADARKLLTEIGAAPPSPGLADEIVVATAALDEKQGAVAEATRRFGEALKQRPRSPRLTLAYAGLLERQGRVPEALQAAEALLQSDPGNAEALNFWGFVAAEHRIDLPRATKRIQAALSFDPGSGAVLDSLGWVHLQSGRLDLANLFLQQAVRLEPEDAEILSHVALLHERQGQTERALAHVRKALQSHPAPALQKQLEDRRNRLERQAPTDRKDKPK